MKLFTNSKEREQARWALTCVFLHGCIGKVPEFPESDQRVALANAIEKCAMAADMMIARAPSEDDQ